MLGTMFILEGINGVGKTTQAALLARSLSQMGHSVRAIRSPGETEFGRRIRPLVLEEQSYKSLLAGELLHVADLLETVQQVIVPAINAGTHIVSDRFTPSTYAYAIHGLGVDEEAVMDLLCFLDKYTGLTRVPVCGLFLDGISPEQARERAIARGRTANKIDAKGACHYARVLDGYRRYIQDREDQDWQTIDANGTVEEVHARVVHAVERYLAEVYA